MLQITLTPDPIAGWRLGITGELLLNHVAGVYTELGDALRAIEERAASFEHSAELARVVPRD